MGFFQHHYTLQVAVLGLVVANCSSTSARVKTVSPPALPKVFVEARTCIENNYVDEIEPQVLMHGTVKGILKVVESGDASMPSGIIEVMQVVKTENFITLSKVYTEALTHIESNASGRNNSQTLLYGAIRGMLEATDPHGFFLPPEFRKESQADTTTAGTGLELTIQNSALTIVTPIEGTPASQAGIQPGDQLLSLDGQTTTGMTLVEAVNKLRGPEGTMVAIRILRPGVSAPQDFRLTRAVIQLKNVRWDILQNNIGYIRLSNFQKTTSEEVEKVLQDLEAGQIRALVLDLRGNSGGDGPLSQAILVAIKFLAKDQLIVSSKGRAERDNHQTFSPNEHARLGYPMVVLVDKAMASGSEIIAGALQDWQRALILGVPTSGRGSTQRIFSLSDGSMLRFTTARLFTPQGHAIQSRGITPDVVLDSPPLTPDNFGDLNTDVQLQRAVQILKSQVTTQIHG
jgi:carboxyl-terminal processing protease